MSGVFDRLHKKLEVEKRDEGISPLDIADLPPNLRMIMRLMLRQVTMDHADLKKAMEDMPEAVRMKMAEFDEALETLKQQGWLIRRGMGEKVHFQVNLRRKPGSKLAAGIWGALDSKIAESKKAEGGKEESTEK